ncbi:MAG: hypothetical protein ACRC2S_10525 [Waterburya sp.]
MPEIISITWRQLTGNKFNKSLDSAMLSEAGSVATLQIRRIGTREKDVYSVNYDREYAVEFICRKFCKPLSFLGKKKILELVNDAWELYEKNSLNPHFVNEPVD